MAVKVLAGYHRWEAIADLDESIHCGGCGPGMTLLCLEHDLESDTYMVRCWEGHRYEADADDPLIAAMLAALSTRQTA